MKKALLIGIFILASQLSATEAHAVENEAFWQCAVAVAGFDIAALTAELTCSTAIVAPTPATVAACLIALGATAVIAAGAYLQCDQFLEGEEEGEGGGNNARKGPPGSPILLDLDRNQFHLSAGPVLFDIDSDGELEIITWISPNSMDAFLYLDRNGNGVADNGLELFGDATLLVNGDLAEHGYEALADFDLAENGGFEDGVVDVSDSVFLDLRVWIDSNADGVCELRETMNLAEAGVQSIGLDYRESPRTDSFGNEFRFIGRGAIDVNGESKKMWTADVFFKVLAN